MRISDWITRARNIILAVGLRVFSKRLNGAFSIYFGKSSLRKRRVVECEYTASDGRIIPVFENYRYSIKAGWRSCLGLGHLAELDGRVIVP